MTSRADSPEPAGATNEPPRICSAFSREPLRGTRAAALDANKWQLGETIRIRFMDGDASLCERVKQAALAWTGPQMANLNLAFVGDGDADVRITFAAGGGSWSMIGTDTRNRPGAPTMNFGWLTPASTDIDVRSVVLHEFGHMLGLIHEHQTPLHPIQWNEPAVIRDLSGPPNSWDLPAIQSNIFDAYKPQAVTGTDRDPSSIMMYRIPPSWTLDGFSTEFNSDLSPLDRQLIAWVYPS
jgi:hypothetical protein